MPRIPFIPSALNLIAATCFALIACNREAKPQNSANDTASLRPSTAITTLPDGTQVVNTTTLAQDVVGYQGHTPVELYIKAGRIDSILLLPHGETDEFYVEAADQLDWTAFEGKMLCEATTASVDAITGATLSSNALIENVRRGIAHAIAQQAPNTP